ncbi:capsule assembly Wzi family protein [Dyadobacter frigoris]|uniref:Capsule assembly Wzi family protein n=1 Tax=Dyadobacter frigoris TaxID=2576211 RepID=A0A4V6BJ84_9BACT|nr:capsule assembly Wzi family protein [Dyadobacter frigoris]TKT93293.1 capsule assembly Wzi family protein [Dyadobacter frigoris]
MRKISVLNFFLCFVLSIGINHAQDSTLTYSFSLLASGANNKTPYWLQSNQYGAIPPYGSSISGQYGIYKIYNPGNPRLFQWSAGAQLITNVSKSSSVFFTDLYVAGKAGPLEISIGQRKGSMGITDSTLTSGSLAISENARPYPKIQISTPNFVNIIPLNDIISFKFSYSDGLLGSAAINYGNVSQVPNTYMHQKSLYLRLGGSRHRLSLYAGFNHQAMWGGEEKIFTGGLKTLEAYKYVILGKPWADSRVGNHFGTIDVAAEWRGNTWNVFLYRQSIYEDGSLAKLTNIADGLNGLRFKRKHIDEKDLSFKLNTVLVEFIYTKEQGGSTFDFDKGIFGRDNYFNHYVYAQGWSYKGRALGTPLIGPQNMYRDNIARDSSNFTANNRIIAFHLGLKASWNKVDLLFKGTFSQNFGTYDFPFPSALSQTSLLIRAERPISIWNRSLLSISLAADIGKLYTNNSALTIGWRKIGFLR